jgi:hypothetical protein
MYSGSRNSLSAEDMKVKRARVLAAVSLLLFVFQAQAGRISPVIASTPDMGAGFGTSLANTVNGVGLSSVSLTATHAATIPSNSWVSGTGILAGHVIFDLGATFLVDSFSFWNQNSGGPGLLGSTGIRGVQVDTSLNGVAYLPLLGAPTLFNQVMTASAGPQIFTFTPVSARFFQFTIVTNWGDTGQTGFAEVGFNNAIPEPATFSLMAMGAFAIRILIRRKQTSS